MPLNFDYDFLVCTIQQIYFLRCLLAVMTQIVNSETVTFDTVRHSPVTITHDDLLIASNMNPVILRPVYKTGWCLNQIVHTLIVLL